MAHAGLGLGRCCLSQFSGSVWENVKVLETDGGDGGIDALRHSKSGKTAQPLENLPRKFKDPRSGPQPSFEKNKTGNGGTCL